jgi:hypothetical protein
LTQSSPFKLRAFASIKKALTALLVNTQNGMLLTASRAWGYGAASAALPH